MKEDINIFIGLDEPYKIAYDVCKNSILKNNKKYNLNIKPINFNTVKDYDRKKDKNESTQFSFARFWTPYESNFKGISIFLDSDFLFLESIDDLIDLYDPKKAVMCCKHDYTPSETTKMDGKVQTIYPRKNWSSLMLFNCSDSHCKELTPDVINSESPKYLHRMLWTDDKKIGNIPLEYNWLEGDYDNSVNPKAIHFTNGGPWHSSWDGDYKQIWLNQYNTL